jgi:hypothetical protein
MKARRSPRTKGDAPVGQNIHVLVFEEECTLAPALSGALQIVDRNEDDLKARTFEQNKFGGTVQADNAERQTKADLNGENGVPEDNYLIVESNDVPLARELLEIGRHFDSEYYANEYPDIVSRRPNLLKHFCEYGWREGRNPNAFFDTVTYLLQNKDVARSKINPYSHYLKHGMTEGRIASSAISPSIRSRLLFGAGIRDWVERLRPHVDEDYYRHQFEDLNVTGLDLAAHFAYRGWREGKSPNPSFDVSAWIQAHPMVMRFVVNPLLVQLEVERGSFDPFLLSESKSDDSPPKVGQSDVSSPSIEISTFVPNDEGQLKHDYDNQMDLVRSEFSSSYYLACYPDVANSGIDPLDHFLYTGWHEGRNPNTKFDTQYYLRSNTDVRILGVNPFIHFLKIGRFESRRPQPIQNGVVESSLKVDNSDSERDQLSIVQREFSKDYYLAAYPDVAQAGIDPLSHFFHTGWREGRNPNQNFDTKYYLKMNEDVRCAGVNPYWHYLVSGRTEGRLPRRPGGYRRQIVDAAVEPANSPPVSIDPSEKPISSAEVRRKLKAAIKGKKGLIVSLSHDCYIRVIGGTQIFIADEQRRFNELGYAYVHLSPQMPRLMLVEEDPQFLTRLVVNGKLLGLSPIREIMRVFKHLQSSGGQPSLLIVHCILGFYVRDVINLCSALQPERRIYWLHDYSSICEGFNLLRNDAQFCGAPPPESLACRVCVYGKTRLKHLEGIRSLFAACKFDVVSPSLFTLHLWRKSIDLPHISESAHPHSQLVSKKWPRRTHSRKLLTDPVAVAFVGFPSANKGWPIFSETVWRLANDPRYKFFHFAAKGASSLPGVKFIRTEVTSKDRDATQRLLAENGIDLVMLLSPWPETFSFIAHEAIVAGAKLICLSDSGNVADLVRNLDIGRILPDGDALIDFFTSGAAVSLIRESKRKSTSYEIEHIGTTATIEGILELTGKREK